MIDHRQVETLYKALQEAPSLEAFMAEHGEELHSESMSELLGALIAEKKLSKAALARRSATSEVYLHQVLSGRRRPSRDRMICLCLGLECSMEHTQELLQRCGYSILNLYDRRDAVLLYCILHHKTVFESHDLLERYGEPLLIR